VDIRSAIDEIAVSIEFDIGEIPEHPVARIGTVCDMAISGLRTLAGCALLLDADADAFCQSLAKSAELRRYFLDRCRRETPALRDGYRAAGNSAALFDALAARRFDLARDIASLSNTTWWEGEEYLEDFALAHLLHLLVQDASPNGIEVSQALLNLERALDGAEPAKLALCRAIVQRDQAAFDEAFDSLLVARNAELLEQGDPYTPYDEAAHRVANTFYIDGLALLNLADRFFLTTRDEYRYCPRSARVAPATVAGNTP
jgi:hypothetical protein